MEEKIGKVILDTTCYPGKDLYSDGAIEDEMLAISRDFAPEEFNRVISERKSWPILLSFFSYQGEYSELDSLYRRREGSGDWFRMWCCDRSSL